MNKSALSHWKLVELLDKAGAFVGNYNLPVRVGSGGFGPFGDIKAVYVSSAKDEIVLLGSDEEIADTKKYTEGRLFV